MHIPFKVKKALIIPLIFGISLMLKSKSYAPTSYWEQAFKDASLIAKIEFTTSGSHVAPAEVLTVYKGEHPQKEIYIGGLAFTKYPINKDTQAIVFLDNNFVMLPRDDFEDEKLAPEIVQQHILFDAAHANKNAYICEYNYFHIIHDGQVDINLASNQNNNKQSISAEEFEQFLLNYWNTDYSDFHKTILTKISQTNTSTPEYAQYLMMLCKTNYNLFHDWYNEAANTENKWTQIALTKLLRNIPGTASQAILAKSLNDSANHDFHEDIITSIEKFQSPSSGRIILDFLIADSTVLDPVNCKTIDSKYINAIQALGNLKYQPAISHLVSLLDVKNTNTWLLKTTISAIYDIDSTFHSCSYLKPHMDQKGRQALAAAGEIADLKLTDCRHLLVETLRNSNRSNNYGQIYLTLLANFKDEENNQLLIADFDHFLDTIHTLPAWSAEKWCSAYIEKFKLLNAVAAKPLIYHLMHQLIGINEHYTSYPQLFSIKTELETHLKETIEAKSNRIKVDKVIAYILNPEDVATGQTPQVKYAVDLNIPFDDDHYEDGRLRAPIVQAIHNYSDLKLEDYGIFQDKDGTHYHKNSLAFEFRDRLSCAIIAYFLALGTEAELNLIETTESLDLWKNNTLF